MSKLVVFLIVKMLLRSLKNQTAIQSLTTTINIVIKCKISIKTISRDII